MGPLRVWSWILIGLFLGIGIIATGFGFYYLRQVWLLESRSPTSQPASTTETRKPTSGGKPPQTTTYYHNPNNAVEIDILR